MGSSYLVTGARLRCMWGSEPGRLVIPEGCYTADGRPKATETDCKKKSIFLISANANYAKTEKPAKNVWN